MDFDLSVIITGEAGQGIQTIGGFFSKILKDSGMNFIANQDYMSRVRGGNNSYLLRIGEMRPLSFKKNFDLLVPLTAECISLHRENLSIEGKIIVDKTHFGISDNHSAYIEAPLHGIAMDTGGKPQYISSVVIGLLSGIVCVDFEIVKRVLQSAFLAQGKDVLDANIVCARKGFEIGNKNQSGSMSVPIKRVEGRHLLDGNEAIALGALFAGCRFYSGYPMTPSTTIMETMAGFSLSHPLVVEQAEDEIAAINMSIGASFAGISSMTATSGGGFCLMTEAISLAAMLETPLVVVDAQRPGPATGLPTRTEQADLDLVIHAGHGEFARAVYAPGSIEEAFTLTVKAFDVADRFQIPVIILTDQYLSDMVYPVDKLETSGLPRKRSVISKGKSVSVNGYRRYEITDSCISPQAVPSWISDAVYADSDEHTPLGHSTEDENLRVAMVEKRFFKKMELLRNEALSPIADGLDNAELILLGFGSTLGIIEEVCREASFARIGRIHFSQVWPFPAKAFISALAKAPRAPLFSVENNAGAQLAHLIRRETDIKVDASILKYSGRPFTIDELSKRVTEYWRKNGIETVQKR